MIVQHKPHPQPPRRPPHPVDPDEPWPDAGDARLQHNAGGKQDIRLEPTARAQPTAG